MRDLVRPGRVLNEESKDGWEVTMRRLLGERETTLHLVGAGNPLRGDDSAGLRVVSLLLKRLGRRPRRNVVIHPPEETPERVLSRVDCTRERVLIFDAVETGGQPGQVVLANLAESRFGYFATHNVPFKVIPGAAANPANIYVSGIEPLNLDIGEGLSEPVRASVSLVAEVVESALGGGIHGPH